jgi:hypothetical protein
MTPISDLAVVRASSEEVKAGRMGTARMLNIDSCVININNAGVATNSNLA